MNSLQLEMNRGKLREKLEANEISEQAQQEKFAIGMEEMKMRNMALLARNPSSKQSRCKSMLCFVFSRISIVHQHSFLQRLLNSKHCSFPEQEVKYCHNRNDSDNYCSTVVCH